MFSAIFRMFAASVRSPWVRALASARQWRCSHSSLAMRRAAPVTDTLTPDLHQVPIVLHCCRAPPPGGTEVLGARYPAVATDTSISPAAIELSIANILMDSYRNNRCDESHHVGSDCYLRRLVCFVGCILVYYAQAPGAQSKRPSIPTELLR